METCQVSHLSKPKALCFSTILGAVQTSVTREQNGTCVVQTGTFWSISTLNFFRVCTVGNFFAPSLIVLTFVSCEVHKNFLTLSLLLKAFHHLIFLWFWQYEQPHMHKRWSFQCPVNRTVIQSTTVHSCSIRPLKHSFRVDSIKTVRNNTHQTSIYRVKVLWPDTANTLIPERDNFSKIFMVAIEINF